MRTAIITLTLVLVLAAAALAQSLSSVFFDPKEPVAAGENIKGLIQQSNGLTALGDVNVQGTVSDDLFAYWAGSFNGNRYYYDQYTTYWRPGPINYIHSSLSFQGDSVEGWVRQFGSYTDYNNFFGKDGVYYKRIVIKRNRNRNTNKRRQILYTYFINTATGDRSDSGAPPYIVIGSADGDFIKAQMASKEQVFQQILDANPAFPKWQTTEFTAPGQIVVHNGAPENMEDGLLTLSGAEVSPIAVQ